MYKSRLLLVFVICIAIILPGCTGEETINQEKTSTGIHFTDDLGHEINMDKPAERIISLYSAHTENLFALGLDREIIGVGKSEAYPPRVVEKDVYDYGSDPEKVIAANPDLVLIRPFIKNSSPAFVEALEKAGINVVCLYPESYEEFVPYIEKLALLSGREEKAKELLDEFKGDIERISQITGSIEPKVRVYFESTETQYRTVTPDSIAAHAVEYAGGINIASDAKAVREGSSIASYGIERILEKAGDIDVYVAQRGAMNSGGTPHGIQTRPGFYAIKAVKEGRIYNIDEKLVSSPTFRFSKGVKELARMFYPEVFDDIGVFNDNQPVTREKMARIAVMFRHKSIFSPTSKYYGQPHRGHVYGGFSDVGVDHPGFDYIETAVLSGYMDGYGDEFRPDEKITREGLAEVLFMLADLEDLAGTPDIKDINACDSPRMVEIVVENGLMELKNNEFNPLDPVTGAEVVKALERIKQIESESN